jgi:hypothetical protein
MIRTQEQVKKDLQTFDDIIVSLKKQLKYVELSRHEMTKQLTIPVVSSSSKPEPPRPPLSRTIRTGVGRFCKNCNSTMSRSGFLMLIGKRYCDNKKCPNSKPEKNYY